MKKSQSKIMLIFSLIFIVLLSLIYAVQTNLLSPVDVFLDTDGYLDLRASCKPTSQDDYDGTTSWNITNATLYSNVDGTWKANVTLIPTGPTENKTFLFNFTNHINKSAEGEFQWNVLCNENNATNNAVIQSAFAGNRTIKVQYARPTISIDSPLNNVLDLDGHDIVVNCTFMASAGWNLTSLNLQTNLDGTWRTNASVPVNTPLEQVQGFVINGFGNDSIADGNLSFFSCMAEQNKTVTLTSVRTESMVVSNNAAANLSLEVQYPPTVALNSPADANWSKFQRTALVYTPSSAHGASNMFPFRTRIWTNQTGGAWLPATGEGTVGNNTQKSQLYTFPEQSAILWGIQVIQADDSRVFNFSVNRTINIDATDPTISVGTSNNSIQDGTDIQLKFTPTDNNIARVVLFTNITEGTYSANYTNASTTLNTGEEITVHLAHDPDGTFIFNITANDSAGRLVNSEIFTFKIDNTAPGISALTNSSAITKCRARNMTWTANETANHTFYWDTDTNTADGTIITSSTKETSHSLILDYGLNTEVDTYINITSCDEAGNCGTSGQFTFTPPASVCAGWNQYAVYDTLINLDTIQNQSGADLVYFWNATNQDWVFLAAGLSSNAGTTMGFKTPYHVVHLFENTNSTWYRNTTNRGDYQYNITSISNFLSVPTVYNFGNLSESFLNESTIPSFVNDSGGTTTFGPYNITAFAGYNNSIQDYVNHIFNFTFANATLLQPCLRRTENPTCMETFWVASNFNVSWNTTNVYSNWTI